MSDSEAALQVAKHLLKAKKCIVITGAGISVSSGIPDFRSADGLYNLVKAKYPDTVMQGKDLFDATLFRNADTTKLFYTFMGEMYKLSADANQTKTHQFLTELHKQKRLTRWYTQNIDGLELRTGLDADLDNPDCSVVQLHGTLEQAMCTLCKRVVEMSKEILDAFLKGQSVSCTVCKEKLDNRLALGKRSIPVGMLRPNVVLYNEEHTNGHVIADLVGKDMKKKPDTIIVIGTSLKVHGLKGLLKNLNSSLTKNGKMILINKTSVGKEWQGFFDYELYDECDKVIEEIWSVMKKEKMQTKLDFKPLKLSIRKTKVCEADVPKENIPVKEEKPKTIKAAFRTIKGAIGQKQKKPIVVKTEDSAATLNA